MSTEAEKVKAGLAVLRESFATGQTKTLAWRRTQLNQMMKLCREGRNRLCKALNTDLHKSVAEGYFTEVNLVEQEIQHALDDVEEWMQPKQVSTNALNLPGKSYIHQDPLGVVLVIGAWNYPVQLTLLPIVGALAAGNCVAVKLPSNKYSGATSEMLARLINAYMNPAFVKVFEGDRHMTQAVLGERWDHIFFTGGCFVGQMVAESAAKHLTPTTLELGGKSPCIVDRTASLAVAAKRAAWGAFMNAGQTCIRPDYFLVHEAIADKFLKEVEKAVREMYSNNPKSSEWFGRVINTRAHERLAGVLEKDKQFIRFGGEVDQKTRYVAPTLLDFGTNTDAFVNSASMSDEIFGPIVPVLRYKSLDWPIKYINDNEKPLACYVFSSDPEVQQSVMAQTSSGCCVLNDTMMQMANSSLPFGGVGKSGMGRYHGKASFDCFTHQKSVLHRAFILDAPIRYPPYSPVAVAILEFLQAPRPKAVVRRFQILLVFIAFAVAYFSRQRFGGAILAIAQLLERVGYAMQHSG